MTTRATIDVDGIPISYLTAGEGGPLVLLLHGTYWSRVWQPVVDDIAAAGLHPVAVDFPGCGRSGGELTVTAASIPRLAAWLVRFLEAFGKKGPVMVAGHDIGGGVAQHLSLTRALARPAGEAEIAEYLEPWTDPRVARSWLALAGAADNRYTLELLPGLRESTTPKLLVWGEDDQFQTVDYAERFASEIPATRLIRIARAGHIPMENKPATIARRSATSSPGIERWTAKLRTPLPYRGRICRSFLVLLDRARSQGIID